MTRRISAATIVLVLNNTCLVSKKTLRVNRKTRQLFATILNMAMVVLLSANPVIASLPNCLCFLSATNQTDQERCCTSAADAIHKVPAQPSCCSTVKLSTCKCNPNAEFCECVDCQCASAPEVPPPPATPFSTAETLQLIVTSVEADWTIPEELKASPPRPVTSTSLKSLTSQQVCVFLSRFLC